MALCGMASATAFRSSWICLLGLAFDCVIEKGANDLRASGGITGLLVEPVEDAIGKADVDGLCHGDLKRAHRSVL